MPLLQVVLDLDETLVCAFREAAVPKRLQSPQAMAATHAFKMHCDLGNGQAGNVVVFQRPGLQEFLLKASQFADLVVFTAGLASKLSIHCSCLIHC